jgi:large conductance mechanosensitive channel
MSVVSEFKAFISRGNVVDLAVAVVIGAAFGKIVDSFVKDVITPPLGLLIGGVDFTNLKIKIGGLTDAPPVTLNYGIFLQACFNFFIIAGAVFLLVKIVSSVTKKPAAPEAPSVPPPPTPTEVLLAEIRDELRRRP